ncbi:MAG: HAMP domain-containing histidine kinase [Lachnospiraceae bacterium]|nr:HAMP domain-containing histidine kinase [Lachnospiraceae bacterium]
MKTKTGSFRFKLWTYFAAFTAVIFLVLWLLQTVFLQGLYESMIIRNVKSSAKKIVEKTSSCTNEDEVSAYIDSLAYDDTLLVYITDVNFTKRYSSNLYKKPQDVERVNRGQRGKNNRDFLPLNRPDDAPQDSRPDGKPADQGYWTQQSDESLPIPFFYIDYMNQLAASGEDSFESRMEDMYVYAMYLDDYCGAGRSVLYLTTTITAVGSSVRVLRVQLLWVTGLSLLLGFALSWFMARKFSAPVNRLSKKAALLGDREYSEDFPRGFCDELDNLSDTLDRTNGKLNASRTFQTELMANVSHDLRTPLTMIKGYAEMINDISWEDRDQCREDMQVIVKEADRLTALVNEILVYSELQSIDSFADTSDVDLSGVVRSVVNSFSTLCKPEGITVESDIVDDICVRGSRSHLERAVFNLAENAARHTGESKRIRIALSQSGSEALSDSGADAKYARIDVTDYGEGIAESDLPHIWERYYTARQRGGKGVSGLGLAIVKQIATIHGGRCFVVSHPNEGSTFTILIPLG